jgi:hypothetical protein
MGNGLDASGRAAPVPGTTAAAAFPQVRGRSLLGAELELPRDLPAELTIVVIAFQQWHQARVDRWIARAVAAGVPATPRLAAGRLPVAVVELPVLSAAWRPVRRFIDGGMTAGIGDPDILARTITVYTNVGAFRDALGIPDSSDVHAMVVRPDGTILARAAGEPEGGWPSIAEAVPTISTVDADGA